MRKRHVEDFDLGNLFQEPVPLTLREQQDIEYAEAEARDLERINLQRLNQRIREWAQESVNVDEIRAARLARFE